MGAHFEDDLSRVAATGQPHESDDHITVGEAELWLQTSLLPLADMGSEFVMGVSRDITDSKRLENALRGHAEEAEHLASHDALTGLENRRAFMSALDRAVALARRGTSSTVLFVDIDQFKRCNDERGHAFGDTVLVSVAGLLKKEVRDVDLVARIGGDEYGVLLSGSDEAGAMVVVQRMRRSVQALGVEIGVPIDLSAGIAGVEADVGVEQIISTADQRMYAYKAAHSSAREPTQRT